jgi:uncharacterized membrane protein
MKKNNIIWLIIKTMIIIITFMIFTPIVTPNGEYNPELFGMPYTLWTGMLIYIILVILNIIGVTVHSKIYMEENND